PRGDPVRDGGRTAARETAQGSRGNVCPAPRRQGPAAAGRGAAPAPGDGPAPGRRLRRVGQGLRPLPAILSEEHTAAGGPVPSRRERLLRGPGGGEEPEPD